MITKIQIKNINSIKETTISFEKSRYHYLCENIYNDKLVNPIAFYGTNGSGKTSFIDAIAQLIQILIKEPGSYAMFIPNLFNEDVIISEFKVWLILNSHEYIYDIKTHYDFGIVDESLSIDGEEIFLKLDVNTFKYTDRVESLNSSTFSVLRKIASNLNDEHIIIVYNFLSNIAYIDAEKQIFLSKQLTQKSINELMVEKSDDVKEILRMYNNFPVYSYFSKNSFDGNKNYYFKIDIQGKQKSLHNIFMSSGMYNQSVMLSILTSISENSVMIIDQIDNALHPITIMNFIEVIKARNIQLIFTSHNTYILQKLRPDQILFANWNNGSSNYKKLSDIYPNIREVNNIEKMYLSHIFDDDIGIND